MKYIKLNESIFNRSEWPLVRDTIQRALPFTIINFISDRDRDKFILAFTPNDYAIQVFNNPYTGKQYSSLFIPAKYDAKMKRKLKGFSLASVIYRKGNDIWYKDAKDLYKIGQNIASFTDPIKNKYHYFKIDGIYYEFI